MDHALRQALESSSREPQTPSSRRIVYASRVRPRPLHIALWIVQGLLALAFGAAGFMKLMTPIAALATAMPWVESAPWLVRFIGVAEVLGAVGLILPSATRVVPQLTVWAAAGLNTIMVLALGLHVYRSEWSALTAPFVLGVMASFVVWGRTMREEILPRVPASARIGGRLLN